VVPPTSRWSGLTAAEMQRALRGPLKGIASYCVGRLTRPSEPGGLCFRLQVRLEEKRSWLEVTLNRPSALNALNTEMVDAITAGYKSLVQAGSPVRGILLQGGGDRVCILLLFVPRFTCACRTPHRPGTLCPAPLPAILSRSTVPMCMLAQLPA
jgi:hypothetical protein